MTISRLILLFLTLSPAAIYARMIDPEPQQVKSTDRSVIVDQAGSGDFKTIKAAIDSVPNDNKQWFRIHIKAGTYKEQLTIPKEKQFICLEGEGQGKTTIQWSAAGDPRVSSVFTLFADNFVASQITFKNMHDLQVQGPHPFSVAPAIVIWGDKASFYDCGFISLQDTLGDWKGRHYFNSCYIEGGMDFIWGGGQSQYVNCKIYSTAANLGPGRVIGYVTAQGQDGASGSNAFVFHKCTVEGKGLTYLGRAYRADSTVIFSQTHLGSIIVPQGWDAWNYANQVSTITYVESECTGPGSNTSGRVKWMKQLSSADLDKYLDRAKFISEDGWIEAQPSLG